MSNKVGATGFEPATSCSRSRRATGLRYAPPTLLVNEPSDAPGESRTPNLLIRSQMLYPVELRAPNESITCPRRKNEAFRDRLESYFSGGAKSIATQYYPATY